MIRPWLGSLLALVVCVGGGGGGCRARSLTDPNGGTQQQLDGSGLRSEASFNGSFDGSFDRTPIDVTEIDPCPCPLDAGIGRLSWDCFCGRFGCGQSEAQLCGTSATAASACGLMVFTWQTANGPLQRVFDARGLLVGGRVSTDEANDPSLGCPGAFSVIGGQYPDSSCAYAPCSCGSTQSIICPAPAAGTTPTPDAGTTFALSPR